MKLRKDYDGGWILATRTHETAFGFDWKHWNFDRYFWNRASWHILFCKKAMEMIRKWLNIFWRTFFAGCSGDPCPYCETPTIESAYWTNAEKCPNCDWRCCKN